jgi:hypothetical protein
MYRREKITARVSWHEKHAIDAHARRLGLTTSEWLRTVAFTELERVWGREDLRRTMYPQEHQGTPAPFRPQLTAETPERDRRLQRDAEP